MYEQKLVEEMMRAMGQHVPGRPTLDDYPFELRKELIREEVQEFYDACDDRDITAMADALVDIMVVTLGAGSAAGIDLGPLFAEVHRTNMAKVGPDGKVIRREDGKVLKPEGWEPPRIQKLLEIQIERK